MLPELVNLYQVLPNPSGPVVKVPFMVTAGVGALTMISPDPPPLLPFVLDAPPPPVLITPAVCGVLEPPPPNDIDGLGELPKPPP